MSAPSLSRAAIYARVSTFDQEPENQLAELRRYVTARGWTLHEYIDRGISGAKDRRPAVLRNYFELRRSCRLRLEAVFVMHTTEERRRVACSSLEWLEVSTPVLVIRRRFDTLFTVASGEIDQVFRFDVNVVFSCLRNRCYKAECGPSALDCLSLALKPFSSHRLATA
jgi:hypothetical protein